MFSFFFTMFKFEWNYFFSFSQKKYIHCALKSGDPKAFKNGCSGF